MVNLFFALATFLLYCNIGGDSWVLYHEEEVRKIAQKKCPRARHCDLAWVAMSGYGTMLIFAKFIQNIEAIDKVSVRVQIIISLSLPRRFSVGR